VSAIHPTTWRPPPFFGTRTRQRLVIGAALAYLVWSVSTLNVDANRALAGFGRALDLFVRMLPPDFSRWELLVKGMKESLQMAFAATLAGVVLSVPLGIAAARNLAPPPVYLAARGLIVVGTSPNRLATSLEDVEEVVAERPGRLGLARVGHGLAAAGLGLGELDRAAVALEEAQGRLGHLRVELVDVAGDEEGDRRHGAKSRHARRRSGSAAGSEVAFRG